MSDITRIEPDAPQSTPPDFAIGNFLLFVSESCDYSALAGVDAVSLRALSELSHDAYRCICVRNARVGELVEAIRGVNERSRRAFDMPEPEAKVAAVALFFAKRASAFKRFGLGVEFFERTRLLAEAVYAAIETRGASVHDIVLALREVRPHGSILAELPSIQAKVRAENAE